MVIFPPCFCDFRVPLKTYAFLAFLTVATMGLSNTSLGYLNYPTQVRTCTAYHCRITDTGESLCVSVVSSLVVSCGISVVVQVIFKSCKLIPVMIGGMIIQGEPPI